MAKYTRWAPLLIHAMPEGLRVTFFSDGEDEDLDGGWDLFETTHPAEADALFEIISPMLEDLKKDLQYERQYANLLLQGDDLGAARLKVCHKASKLNW